MAFTAIKHAMIYPLTDSVVVFMWLPKMIKKNLKKSLIKIVNFFLNRLVKFMELNDDNF